MARIWLLALISPCLLVQTWRWDNPEPTGETLYGVHGTSGLVMCVGEHSGLIENTTSSTWRLYDMNLGITFRDTWAAHDHAVFAVGGDAGHGGTIFFFDGTTWSQMTESEFRYLNSIWGTSDTNVYAVGYSPSIGGYAIQRYDGSGWAPMAAMINPDGLYGVSGWDATHAIAVGGNAVILYDGDGNNDGQPDIYWEDDSPGFLTQPFVLRDVWASTGTDAIAVGRDSSGVGLIIHRQGGSWVQQSLPTTETLNAVWGLAPDFVFAVGDYGLILKYDGAWTPIDSGTTQNLYDVWGRSSNEVYAVGEDGTIIRFDGTQWFPIHSLPGARDNLYDIWSSGTKAYMCGQGDGTTLLTFENETWRRYRSSVNANTAIWGADPSHVFAVGVSGKAQMYDGQAWRSMNTGTTHYLLDVWGVSADNVFAVGNFGGGTGTIVHYTGDTDLNWDVLVDDFTYSIDQVWTATGATLILSAGGYNKLWEYSSGIFSEISPTDMPYYATIWGPSGSVYFVGGNGGRILRNSSGSWTTMAVGTLSTRVVKLWGTASNDVYALGDDGYLYHYDGNAGNTWTAMPTPVTGGLNAGALFGSEVMLIGNAGVIVKSQGSPLTKHKAGPTWDTQTFPASQTPFLYASWGQDWTNIYAVGEKAVVLKFNGQDWQNEIATMNTDENFRYIKGFDTGEKVLIGGDGSEGSSTYGRAYWFDGASWLQMNMPAATSMLLGGHATGPDDVVAVGWQGKIRHFDGNPTLDWTAITTDTTQKLYAVWSNGAGGVAVGEMGTVVSFNQTSGTAETIAGAGLLMSIVQIGGEYFIGGRTQSDLDGIIYRGGPGNWTPMTFDVPRSQIVMIRSIWGDSIGNIWAVVGQVSDSTGGGGIFHYDGNPSDMWYQQPSPAYKSLRDITNIGSDPDHLIIVGENGLILKQDTLQDYHDSILEWPQTTILDILLYLP